VQLAHLRQLSHKVHSQTLKVRPKQRKHNEVLPSHYFSSCLNLLCNVFMFIYDWYIFPLIFTQNNSYFYTLYICLLYKSRKIIWMFYGKFADLLRSVLTIKSQLQHVAISSDN
jgi:hypothetical protein